MYFYPMAKKKELSFEENAKQLISIISQLECEYIELDKAIELFSQGVNILASCTEKIAQADGKITELRKGRNGRFVEEMLNEKILNIE